VQSRAAQARNRLKLALARRPAHRLHDQTNPLVSVLIPTYNRAQLLAERSIPSVLCQTYQRFEIVIVGDGCTDQTADVIAKFKDARIRFVNLPEKEALPANPLHAWMVAGTRPANVALGLARGSWIAWLDDDDEFSIDHIEVLLDACRSRHLEFAYGIMDHEEPSGEWHNVGVFPPQCGGIGNASVLYASYLSFMRYDPQAWRREEPGDWNLWRRMWQAGVRMGFVEHIVGRHYARRAPIEPREPACI